MCQSKVMTSKAIDSCLSEAVDVEWIISETDKYSNWEEYNEYFD